MGRFRLTVAQLIKELKKMPQDATVVWRDHDNSADEYNDCVRGCDDYTEEMKGNGSFGPDEKVVVLYG